MKPALKFVRYSTGYGVTVNGVYAGRCFRERNMFAASGTAGWIFLPAPSCSLPKTWETTPRRAVEAAIRRSEEGGK